MNFIPIHLARLEGSAMTLKYGTDAIITSNIFAAPETGNSELTLGIRPEHLTVCDVESGELRATAKVVEALGSDTYIYADMPAGEQVVVRAQSNTRVRRGETIGLHLEELQEHLFAADGRSLARVAS